MHTDMELKTDEQVVTLIDEIMHRLKAGQPYSLLRSDFCIALNQVIEKHGLDWDPHSFARLPEKPLIKWQCWEPKTIKEMGEMFDSFGRSEERIWMSQENWDQLLADMDALMPDDPVIIESTPRTKEEQADFERMFLEKS